MKMSEGLNKYREAVTTSSPTLPLGGYVGYAAGKDASTPVGVVTSSGPQSQGSRAARQPWAGLHNRGAVRRNLELDQNLSEVCRT
jgi:hypothetical protein